MKYLNVLIVLLFLGQSVMANEYTFVGMRGEIYLFDDASALTKLKGPRDISDINGSMYSVSNNEIYVNINTIDHVVYSYGPENKDKTTLDNCLTIRLRGQRKYFPQGEYKKEEFAANHKKYEKQILKEKANWIFMGQSNKWLCYSNPGYNDPGELMENSTWIKDRGTGWEKIYPWEKVIANEFVYPDVVLIRPVTKRAGDSWPPERTGNYYIQLPNEKNLRKIQMDPKAKHLWANARSVFFQLGKDILRVDYADGQQQPVKICEIEDELFCMYEKENILAALADDGEKNHEKD